MIDYDPLASLVLGVFLIYLGVGMTFIYWENE